MRGRLAVKTRKIITLIITILMFASLLTGCGANQPADTNSKEAEENTATRIVQHFMGETEIPEEPKRVVTIQYTGQALALGVIPVGVPEWHLNNHYLKEHLNGVESLGSEEVSLEKILALKPDLIIGSDGEKDIYEDLSKIAPTVLIPWMEYDVDGHLEVVADILGKKDEAKVWQKDFNELAEEQKQAIKQYVGENETVVIFRIFPDSFSVYGDRNMGHIFYRALQLNPPELIKEEIKLQQTGRFNQKKISLEVLPEYSGDHMIVLVNDLKDEDGRIASVTNTSLWKGLPAVKNNKVYFIERNQWLAYDSISLKGQLKDSVEIFKNNK